MSGKHLELRIDIFGEHNQLAQIQTQAQPNLVVSDLIKAIVQEFRGLDQLGDDPAQYQLASMATGLPLPDNEWLRPGIADRLILIDRPVEPPPGSSPLQQRVYLRDQERGKVFRLHWQPAVIGRRQQTRSEEPPLAVNLIDHAAHDYISKRHAQIIEQGGRLMVESLTSKPTQIVTAGGDPVHLVEGKPYPIAHGDLILLVHSRVELRVMIEAELAAA